MLKLIVTDAGVSKGYKDAPALRFNEGEGGSASVRFRIGKRVYDSRYEGNYRWINLNVKAFGDVCERIRKMKLKEGSFINIIRRYDEESWDDKDTGGRRTMPILIADEVEFCYIGEGRNNGQSSSEEETPSTRPTREYSDSDAPPARGSKRKESEPAPDLPENFTGFEGFGGNPFF